MDLFRILDRCTSVYESIMTSPNPNSRQLLQAKVMNGDEISSFWDHDYSVYTRYTRRACQHNQTWLQTLLHIKRLWLKLANDLPSAKWSGQLQISNSCWCVCQQSTTGISFQSSRVNGFGGTVRTDLPCREMSASHEYLPWLNLLYWIVI